jgi:hypothetical protein
VTESSDSVSGREKADFLTGEMRFTVKEIEVFEIADSTDLPVDVAKCVNRRLVEDGISQFSGDLQISSAPSCVTGDPGEDDFKNCCGFLSRSVPIAGCNLQSC